MRHDPASAAVVVMLRGLKMYGMAQAVGELIEQGAPAFETAVPILSQLQTVIDTYSKVGFAKLYTRKTPLTAADILNDRVIPFFDDHDLRVDRLLTDRGTGSVRNFVFGVEIG